MHAGGESSHKTHESHEDEKGPLSQHEEQSSQHEDQFNVPRGFGDDPENDDQDLINDQLLNNDLSRSRRAGHADLKC